jgi:hypothetical protein
MNPMTNIRIGDVLTVPKALGVVTHYAVAFAPGLVVQNTPEKGEHAATVQDFAAGNPVTVHRTGADPSIVVARAQAILASPKKYHPIQNNCEHTVTKIIRGIAQSPQALFWCTVAFLGFVLLLIALMTRKRWA